MGNGFARVCDNRRTHAIYYIGCGVRDVYKRQALGHYAGVDNSTTNGTSVGARTWVGENVNNGTALGVYNLVGRCV